MSADLQTILTMLLIAWAMLYVAWRAWQAFFRKTTGGCGGCAKCPSSNKTPTNLVTVETLLAASKR